MSPTREQLEALRLRTGDVVLLRSESIGRKFLDEWDLFLIRQGWKAKDGRDGVLLLAIGPDETMEQLSDDNKLRLYRFLQASLRHRSPIDLIPEHLGPVEAGLEVYTAPVQRSRRQTKHWLYRKLRHQGRAVAAWITQRESVTAILEPAPIEALQEETAEPQGSPAPPPNPEEVARHG